MVTDKLAALAFIQNWGASFLIGLTSAQHMINEQQ
jgi:hypothetical protein